MTGQDAGGASDAVWDERFSAEHYVYGKEPNAFLEENVAHLYGREVLCLAEGEGRNAVFLARRGFSVTAVDASAVGLDKARRLAAEHGVEIHTVHADLEDYALGIDRWDAIVSVFCHVLTPLRRKVHAQVAAALREGGVFLLEAYTPAQLQNNTGGPRDIDRLMSAEQLQEELAPLEFQCLREVEREIIEGAHHTGTGSVVQVIARKA